MVIKSLAVFMAVFLLSGCQTTNPYTGEQKINNSSKYAGVGALAGAIIGGIADGGRGAVKGAVIGGAAGGGYGYYTDRQEARLRAELQGTGVQVKRQGDTLQLVMPAQITFDSSRAEIKSDFYPVLGSVAKIFQEFNRNRIEIVGHTDSTGSDKINLPLSQARADSVAGYLRGQNIPAARIVAYGRGALEPVADNKTAGGRALNRRVEINLLPPPAKK